MCFKDDYKFMQRYISVLEYIKENWKIMSVSHSVQKCLNLGCLSEIIFAVRKFNLMWVKQIFQEYT